MTGIGRSSVGLTDFRKRLLYRAWRRGTREMDLILGSFADDALENFSNLDCEDFSLLLDQADVDILSWLNNSDSMPVEFSTDVFRRLVQFHKQGGIVKPV